MLSYYSVPIRILQNAFKPTYGRFWVTPARLGRVLQRGDNVTLYLSLVDARTGASLWGEQYERKMQDIAVLQKDIASDVSRKLRARLSNAEAKHLTRNYTDNSEAYQWRISGENRPRKRSDF